MQLAQTLTALDFDEFLKSLDAVSTCLENPRHLRDAAAQASRTLWSSMQRTVDKASEDAASDELDDMTEEKQELEADVERLENELEAQQDLVESHAQTIERLTAAIEAARSELMIAHARGGAHDVTLLPIALALQAALAPPPSEYLATQSVAADPAPRGSVH